MVWKMVVDAEGRRSGPNGVISPVVEAKKCRGLNGEISPIVEMTGSIDDGWLVDSRRVEKLDRPTKKTRTRLLARVLICKVLLVYFTTCRSFSSSRVSSTVSWQMLTRMVPAVTA